MYFGDGEWSSCIFFRRMESLTKALDGHLRSVANVIILVGAKILGDQSASRRLVQGSSIFCPQIRAYPKHFSLRSRLLMSNHRGPLMLFPPWPYPYCTDFSLDSPTIRVLNKNPASMIHVIDLTFPSPPKDIHPDNSNTSTQTHS